MLTEYSIGSNISLAKSCVQAQKSASFDNTSVNVSSPLFLIQRS